MNRRNLLIVAATMLPAFLTGCTVHPAGEQSERQAALDAGKPYEIPADKRTRPSLPENPSVDDFVRYALLTNADLEEQYWQWRAAVEQVTIDGTEPTNLAISLGTTLNNGALALDRTVVTAANDPMTDISFPGKLSAAARRSLENARAAGVRFRKAEYELRRKMVSACDDYALNAELIRLGEENIQLLEMTATITGARNRSGQGGEQDVLNARNELDLAKNDVANMRSELPVERAALNALLDRPATAAIAVPDSLPTMRPIVGSDQEVLDRAARVNPELVALADEIRGKREDLHLATLQYYPDFDVAASTDLKGITQTLLGEFTVPILRYEALHAGVLQAEANLRAIEAARKETSNDLSAQLVDDLTTLRDADRQVDLLEQTILPRAREAVTLARAGYQSGSVSLLEMLGSQRSLIDMERLVANLVIIRDKRLAEVEAIDAGRLETSGVEPF